MAKTYVCAVCKRQVSSRMVHHCGPDIRWRGFFKLQEEMGELNRVLGKLGAFPDGVHPSGENIIADMWDEIADLEAAITYFKEQNVPAFGLALIIGNMIERKEKKLAQFRTWILSGIDVISARRQNDKEGGK